MSDNGQLFADTNHVYECHESSQSWKSLSPESFTDYGILDLNGNGQDVLVGKLKDIEVVMSLELRKYDEVKDTWNTFGGGILTNNYAKLSQDGKHIVVTDGSGIRVFELSRGLIWVQVGQTIASGVSRKIAINDDGSKIAFIVDKTSTYQPGDVDMFVYKLVTESSVMTWKQYGGDLANAGYYGIRVLEISSSTTWVQIGDIIDSNVSRKIVINDDGNQICFSMDYNSGSSVLLSAYRLVTENTGIYWKQIGGYFTTAVGTRVSAST